MSELLPSRPQPRPRFFDQLDRAETAEAIPVEAIGDGGEDTTVEPVMQQRFVTPELIEELYSATSHPRGQPLV